MKPPDLFHIHYIISLSKKQLKTCKYLKNAKGNTVSETVYNALNKPLTITDAMGKSTTYTYNELGLVETVTDSMNHVSEYTYNSRGLNTLDIEAVVSASGQFEGYGNSMYQDAMSYYETDSWSNSIEQAAMDECMSVIVPIYNGEETDITGGALYFHSFPNPEDWAYHNNYTLITVDGTEGFWFYK